MEKNIRRHSIPNLQSCVHRGDPHNLANYLPHATSVIIIVLFIQVLTKCFCVLANNHSHALENPRIFHCNLSRLHRSGLHGTKNSSPHASNPSCDVISALFGRAHTTYLTWTGDTYSSCVEISEDVCPQSSIVLTPKWSTQFGKNITSYHQTPNKLSSAKQHVFVMSYYALAARLPSLDSTSENVLPRYTTLTPKWSVWCGKKSVSCLFDILRHHPDNLQPYIPMWDSHPRKNHASCVKTSENVCSTICDFADTEVYNATWYEFHFNASKNSEYLSTIFEYVNTKRSRNLAKHLLHTIKHPRMIRCNQPTMLTPRCFAQSLVIHLMPMTLCDAVPTIFSHDYAIE